MNALFYVSEVFTLRRIRRLLLILTAGILILVATTACTPTDTASSQMDVPEATAVDVENAQKNLSSQTVNEDNLSRQSPQARKGASSINSISSVR